MRPCYLSDRISSGKTLTLVDLHFGLYLLYAHNQFIRIIVWLWSLYPWGLFYYVRQFFVFVWTLTQPCQFFHSRNTWVLSISNQSQPKNTWEVLVWTHHICRWCHVWPRSSRCINRNVEECLTSSPLSCLWKGTIWHPILSLHYHML